VNPQPVTDTLFVCLHTGEYTKQMPETEKSRVLSRNTGPACIPLKQTFFENAAKKRKPFQNGRVIFQNENISGDGIPRFCGTKW
jgi:hypothetical protein